MEKKTVFFLALCHSIFFSAYIYGQSSSQLLLTDTLTASQSNYEFTVEQNVAVRMRDGTILRADVYKPKEAGQYPVLVGRVGYKLRDWPGDIYTTTGEYYARCGYVVVWQNVRGTFASEGEYYPLKDDAWGRNQDGYDTVEWAAQQEWSNGKVGMLGVSYSGLTQYLTAPTRPPHLVTQFVQMGWGSARNCLFQNGVFQLYDVEWWPLGMTLLQIQNATQPPGIADKQMELEKAIGELGYWQKHLPLNDLPALKGVADWYFDWLKHPAYGPFWHSTDLATQYGEVDVPILHWNGWFDYRLDATLDAFTGIKSEGKSEKCRQGQRLVIGPWNHFSSPAGILDYGPEAVVDVDAYRLRWYDYWLKGIDNNIMDGPPVKIFLMGDNRWIDLEDWPPRNVAEQQLFLHEGTGESVTSLNNGCLTFNQPIGEERPDRYIYNPEEPIPSLRSFMDPGPRDYTQVEGRLLTYTSSELENDLTIIGPVKAIIHGSSSAQDTDWIVRLLDVWPDGRSVSVCEGILRARYRNSTSKQELLEPEKVYVFEVDMSSSAQVFKEGHRLRIHVTSSDFPWFDRNLNTGGPFAEEDSGVKAINTVYHDALRASHIVLPVVQ